MSPLVTGPCGLKDRTIQQLHVSHCAGIPKRGILFVEADLEQTQVAKSLFFVLVNITYSWRSPEKMQYISVSPMSS